MMMKTTSIFPTTVNGKTLLSLIITLFMILLPTWYFFFYSNNNKKRNKKKITTTTQQRKKSKSHKNDNIPWAPGGSIPVLGHALAYKSNPAQFLTSTSLKHDVFQINLAGKYMYIVCGYDQQKQLSNLPESQLSSKQAVANIGFEQTLGTYNVHGGTDLHKGIVKGIWHHHPQDVVIQLTEKLQQSMYMEIISNNSNSNSNNNNISDNDTNANTNTNANKEYDFFKLIRRVVLRSMIDWMISPIFLEIYNDDKNNNLNFIDEFMSFQDQLEDITAKSVVLPRWIALPLMLLPLQQKRLKLQNKIMIALQKLLSLSSDDDDDQQQKQKEGFWLKQILVETQQQNDDDEDGGKFKPNLDIVSELIVGLLFAAHKNPAIGAAQSYLLLHEQGTQEDYDLCTSEAQRLLQSPDYHTLNSCQRLRRVCLETLRLTAHSIGAVRVAQSDIQVKKTKSGGSNGQQQQQQQQHTTTNSNSNQNNYWIIPKGSTIAFPHISSSWNPNYWINPRDVDTTTNRSDELYKDEYKFTTFSNGIHRCPGQPIAMVILQCMLSILLQSYSIKIDDSSISEISFERATLAQRHKPIMVSIQPKG